MLSTDTIFYLIAAILVFLATLQRSKNEETLKEYNILLLPLFTILGICIMLLLIVTVNPDILNAILTIMFILTGYWTLVSNLFYFVEFTEYEIEENLYHKEMSDSEFSEILIDDVNHKNIKKKKTGFKRFIKSCFYATKYAIVHMTLADFFVYLIAATTVTIYALTKNMFLTEIISMSICFQTIREVKLFSVLNGYTVLIIYFFYDLLWFNYGNKLDIFTSKIDVPIKLVLPITLHGYEITGFGDLLIPAFFIAICKRYGEAKKCISFWYVTYIAFCIGIVLGMNNDWMQIKEPPMLLFVSPIVGFSALLYSALLGRTMEFLSYKRKPQDYDTF